MNELSLPLKRRACAVVLEGDDGVKRSFTLRELDGEGRDQHMIKRAQTIVIENGVATGLRSVPGMQSELVALCLVDDKGAAVHEATIQKWPGRVVHALFLKAQELSSLQEAEAKVAGNESAASGSLGSASPTS